MLRFSIVLIVVLTLSPIGSAFAHGNPLISGKPPAEEQNKLQRAAEPRTGVLAPVFEYQAQLYRYLSQQLLDYKKTGSLTTFLFLMIIGLGYGILHAAGPGHGKLISASYFSTHKEPPWRAFQFSLLAALLHTMSALAIVIILKVIMEAFSLLTFETISGYVRIASFSLIGMIGLYMLFHSLKKHVSKHSKNKSTLSFWGLVATVGIVPCPGALVILIFCYSMDIFISGISIVIAMSVGMAFTIGSVGLVASLGRTGIINSSNNLKKYDWIFKTLEICGALLIIVIGIFLLIGELTTH